MKENLSLKNFNDYSKIGINDAIFSNDGIRVRNSRKSSMREEPTGTNDEKIGAQITLECIPNPFSKSVQILFQTIDFSGIQIFVFEVQGK